VSDWRKIVQRKIETARDEILAAVDNSLNDLGTIGDERANQIASVVTDQLGEIESEVTESW
jgi:hypothetical protein